MFLLKITAIVMGNASKTRSMAPWDAISGVVTKQAENGGTVAPGIRTDRK
jgi:hypothetical protein